MAPAKADVTIWPQRKAISGRGFEKVVLHFSTAMGCLLNQGYFK
jgi:hypothetical protein